MKTHDEATGAALGGEPGDTLPLNHKNSDGASNLEPLSAAGSETETAVSAHSLSQVYAIPGPAQPLNSRAMLMARLRAAAAVKQAWELFQKTPEPKRSLRSLKAYEEYRRTLETRVYNLDFWMWATELSADELLTPLVA